MKVVTRKENDVISTREIKTEAFYIGRSRQNDLTLPNPKISRRHAKIFFKDGQWFLEDLRSDNGTRFKGERVIKVRINSGDRFLIGPFEIEFLADLPDKSEDQVTVTSYIEPSALEEPKNKELSSGNFLDAIAVVPQESKLKSFIDERSHDKLAEAPESESIHTVVLDENEPSLPLISQSEDSVKTMIEKEHIDTSMARLVCLDYDHIGEEIKIEKEEIVLGNDEKSDVRILSDDYPTRKATIKSTDATYVIESVDSVSGAYVDGVPVKKRELENHDIIQVGKSRFEFLVGDSKSQIKKPKVIERPLRSKYHLYEEMFSDWRILLISGLAMGLIGITLIKTLSSSRTSPNSPAISQVSDESTRVVLYHLTEAQRLIEEGKIDEAEVRVKIILGKIAPNDLDALKLLRKIQQLREERKERSKLEKEETLQEQGKLQGLLEKHQKLIAEKKFEDAKKIQDEITSIDADSPKSTKTVENLKAITEQAKRQEIAEKKNRQELNRIYFQGVEEFENGNLGAAENLLKEVAQKNKHPYQASAKKILTSIEKQLGSAVAEEIKSAKAKMNSGQTLEGYNDLKSLAKKYPARSDIKQALSSSKKQLESKAKDVYRQGLAMKEMAQDPAAAIDLFEKVLEYVPDPNHEYHKKAKSQINSLQLSP